MSNAESVDIQRRLYTPVYIFYKVKKVTQLTFLLGLFVCLFVCQSFASFSSFW